MSNQENTNGGAEHRAREFSSGRTPRVGDRVVMSDRPDGKMGTVKEVPCMDVALGNLFIMVNWDGDSPNTVSAPRATEVLLVGTR